MRFFLAILWCFLPLAAWGHIGSPNVFFEGTAGPHTVHVVIRPPATLPGLAQMDVRLNGAEAATGARVMIRPVYARAANSSEAVEVEARPTSGDPQLYSATFWLIARGSYAVHVSVQGLAGPGTVVVPLQVAPLRNPQMSAGLAATLIALGLLLLAGAVGLARAGAREATLPPGSTPAPRDFRRGRIAGIAAALILGTTLWLGFLRYRTMVREFANNALSRPVPVAAVVRAEAGGQVLTISPTAENAATTNWEGLVTDHGKLIHLFAIREQGDGGPAAFAHLHPVRRTATALEGVLPPLPPGNYQLYGELTYQDGRSETLVGHAAFPAPAAEAPQAGWTAMNEIWCQSPIVVTGNASEPTALDYDDSWHVNPAPAPPGARSSALMGGYRMIFQTPGELVANRDLSLRFMIVNAAGDAVAVQPYMGMQGHAVVRRTDGTVFTHLHPLGTISMAAQQLMSPAPPPANGLPASNPPPATATREVTFPYAFPRAGNYRIWMQARVASRVLTGVFDVVVNEP